MNEIVNISEFDLEDEVIIGLYSGGVWNIDQGISKPHNAFVIGKYQGGYNVCVGWNGAIEFGLNRGYFHQWDNPSDPHNFVWVPNWKNRFDSIAWLSSGTRVMRATKRVLHKDQKCSVCALPAPHAEPNKNGVFVCSMCALRLELKL